QRRARRRRSPRRLAGRAAPPPQRQPDPHERAPARPLRRAGGGTPASLRRPPPRARLLRHRAAQPQPRRPGRLRPARRGAIDSPRPAGPPAASVEEETTMPDWVEEGEAAPDFSLPADDGRQVKLAQRRGHPVVLYFY